MSFIAQTVGIYIQTQWAATQGTDFESYATGQVTNTTTTDTLMSYTPSGKTLYVSDIQGIIWAIPNSVGWGQGSIGIAVNGTTYLNYALPISYLYEWGGPASGYINWQPDKLPIEAHLQKPIKCPSGSTLTITLYYDSGGNPTQINARISARGWLQ
jgi:hypothetical protein